MEEETYTTSEVARILQMSPSKVRALAADGKLEAKRDEAGHQECAPALGMQSA
jgi:excisionase family DNA binding protein